MLLSFANTDGWPVCAAELDVLFTNTTTGEKLRTNEDHLDLVAHFSPEQAVEPTAFDVVAASSAHSWERFWTSGAALDLGGSEDPRAGELERDQQQIGAQREKKALTLVLHLHL